MSRGTRRSLVYSFHWFHRWGSPSVDRWRYISLDLVSNRLLLGSLTSVEIGRVDSCGSKSPAFGCLCRWLGLVQPSFWDPNECFWLFSLLFLFAWTCLCSNVICLSFSFCCLLEVYWCGFRWQFANFLSVYPLREGKLAKACLISRPNLFVFENQVLQIIFLRALSKAISQHVLMMGWIQFRVLLLGQLCHWMMLIYVNSLQLSNRFHLHYHFW